MQRLKFSLMISVFFLIASTTAFLLQAQEPRVWTNLSNKVVVKSGKLEIDRTFEEMKDGVPTKVYVRIGSTLKFLQFDKISAVDRSYVCRELGLPEDVDRDSSEKSIKIISLEDGLRLPKKEKYAFLVAASHYDSGISSLRYTGNDVEDLRERLIELGFRAENIVVLHSGIDYEDVPTREHIEHRYRQLLSRVQTGDLVLVYLSGHGLQLEGSDVSYFAPVDVKLTDIPNTSVSINQMMKQLSESPAEFRWMIVDACRNDPNNQKSIFTTRATGAKGMTDIENIPRSISLLQSCQPGACSYEGGGNKNPEIHNGIFTLALLEALGEDGKGDVNKDGAVSFLEICQYVSNRTNVLANLYHHVEQIPKLRGDFTDFAFLELGKNEAAQAYQDGNELYDQANYSAALEKFRLACQKEPENREYARTFSMVQAIVEGKLKPPKPPKPPVVVKPDDWSGPFPAGTRKTLTYKGVEFTFCYCPAGSFMMGSPTEEEGRYYDEVQHEVTLTKGFWMLETELTQEQLDVTGFKTQERPRFEGNHYPVETVSWEECNEYIDILNKTLELPVGLKVSLPTEVQWEYACRAGTTTAYFWGDSLNGDRANCNGNYPYGTETKGNCLNTTCAVKSYQANPWGLYDMHGNVYEWCSDLKKDYSGESAIVLFTNSSRVIRGGGWNTHAEYCRSATRGSSAPSYRADNVGFRLVLE